MLTAVLPLLRPMLTAAGVEASDKEIVKAALILACGHPHELAAAVRGVKQAEIDRRPRSHGVYVDPRPVAEYALSAADLDDLLKP